LILGFASALEAAPRLVIPEPNWNAGTVVKGELIRHTFVIRNDGVTDLNLADVRPSCGCTAAEFDRVIPAGKEGRLVLAIETKSFQGPISKSALVLSDDPVSPQTTLVVSAIVKPIVEILPGGFVRIQTLAGERGAGAAVLVSDEAEFTPTAASTSERWLEADILPLPEKERQPNRGARQYRLRVTVSQDAPEGLLGGAVKVQTGLTRMPILEVPLAGFVRPVIGLSTGKINFQNFVPEGEPVRRTLLLTNNNGKNEQFVVTEATVSISEIVAQVVPQDRQKVQVILTVDPKIKKGPFEGSLLLRTNDPLRREIQVPISGTVLVRASEGPPKS
jgi:hypothetical protein